MALAWHESDSPLRDLMYSLVATDAVLHSLRCANLSWGSCKCTAQAECQTGEAVSLPFCQTQAVLFNGGSYLAIGSATSKANLLCTCPLLWALRCH